MPEHNPGQMGGTMRLGRRKTIFKNVESVISELLISVSSMSLLAFLRESLDRVRFFLSRTEAGLSSTPCVNDIRGGHVNTLSFPFLVLVFLLKPVLI